MPGPMGGRPPRGAKPTVANPGKVFKRIIGFVAKNYLLQCIVVLVCIVLTVFSTIQGTMFTKTLIDQYITSDFCDHQPSLESKISKRDRSDRGDVKTKY